MIKVNLGLQGPIGALGSLLWVLMGPQFQYLTQYSNGQKFSISRVLILENPIGKGVHIAIAPN